MNQPPTSARVAWRALGNRSSPISSTSPEVNIRLGALYIGSLYNKFGHEVPLTARHLQRRAARDERGGARNTAAIPTDEFVELIAFAQTREYVKRVVSLYAKLPVSVRSFTLRSSPRARHESRPGPDF